MKVHVRIGLPLNLPIAIKQSLFEGCVGIKNYDNAYFVSIPPCRFVDIPDTIWSEGFDSDAAGAKLIK